jgi:hypothetical protein
MNAHTRDDETRAVFEVPEGMLDYQARCAIRDLIRLYGFEEARQMVANFLIDEAERKPRQ